MIERKMYIANDQLNESITIYQEKTTPETDMYMGSPYEAPAKNFRHGFWTAEAISRKPSPIPMVMPLPFGTNPESFRKNFM